MEEQEKEAFAYLAELRGRGNEEEAIEFERFLTNMIKKQKTKVALLNLQRTVGEFVFDARLQLRQISRSIELAKSINIEKRHNPFCSDGSCSFCRPQTEDLEISTVAATLDEALREQKDVFKKRMVNY